MASFVSVKDLQTAREEKRHARQKLLSEEEAKFLVKEQARKKHKESGNDRWMLPGIEKRIDAEASKLAELSSGKKHKKKKRKKKRSTSESSDSDTEQRWEEKPIEQERLVRKEPENWLNFDDVVCGNRTYTSETIKEQKKAEKAATRDACTREDESVGQHPRELNPHWKHGGEGLPPQDGAVEKKNNKVHKEWLLKSLKRMNEQAKEQNRTIESIAAERYGSWEEFQRMLKEADPKRSGRDCREGIRYHDDGMNKRSKMGFLKPRDEEGDSDRKQRRSFKRPGEDDGDRDSRRSLKESKRDRGRNKGHVPSWKKSSRDSRRSRSPERQSPNRRSWKSENEKSRDTSKNHSSRSGSRTSEKKMEKSPKKILSTETGKVSEQDRGNIKVYTVEKPPDLQPEIFDQKEQPHKVENRPQKDSALKPAALTEKEKNQLAAKILKAELMGNEKLANTLKLKLQKAREAVNSVPASPESAAQRAEKHLSGSESSEEETVVLTRTGKDGQQWPLQHSDAAYDSVPRKKRKKTKVPSHRDGQRERYFADDDRHSLEDLVRREKTMEAEDQHAMFSRLASKQFQGTDSEYFTLDDMYVSEASRQNTRTDEEARQKQKAIADHRKLSRRLEKCRLCFGNPELPKHLLIAIGKKCYLALPDHKPLTEGHCIIVPMHHCSTGTSVDEDVWAELRRFMRELQSMFKSQDKDCVFMQTCIGLKKARHFFVDCLPMPGEEADMAPIFFKKAIQESETEWSHNKKLVDTRGKEFQKCIPKGLPYFSVDFGMDGGFAHVVEDEALFPSYFGREIVGGMLDVEPRLWRHPPKDHFTEQTTRSVRFSEWWKPHDWTADISGTS